MRTKMLHKHALIHVMRDVCIEALCDRRHDFSYLLRRVAWQSLRMECGEEVCCVSNGDDDATNP